MNILCDCCENYYKFDFNLYISSYDDLKLFIKKKFGPGYKYTKNNKRIIYELYNHWLNFGKLEKRKCVKQLNWYKNKYICFNCFTKDQEAVNYNKDIDVKFINNNKDIDLKSGNNNKDIDLKFGNKRKVLIIINPPEWNYTILTDLYNVLNENFGNSYTFIIYSSEYGFINYQNIDKSYIFEMVLNEEDIVLLGSIWNHAHTEKRWYNFLINMLRLNVKVGIMPIRECMDFFCPTFKKRENGENHTLRIDKLVESDEDEKLLEKIVFFYNRRNYFLVEKLGWENSVFSFQDSMYFKDYYPNNKVVLTDPLSEKKFKKLIDKNEFYNYYSIPSNKKIIVAYLMMSAEAFWEEWSDWFASVMNSQLTYTRNPNVYKRNVMGRLLVYNINEIQKILSDLGFFLLIKLHPEERMWRWGENCWRSDVAPELKSENPHNFNNSIPIIESDHSSEVIQYADKFIFAGDTSAQYKIYEKKKGSIYLVDRDCDWLNVKTCLCNYTNIYGNVLYRHEIFDSNNMLNKTVFIELLKQYLLTENYQYNNLDEIRVKPEENTTEIFRSILTTFNAKLTSISKQSDFPRAIESH